MKALSPHRAGSMTDLLPILTGRLVLRDFTMEDGPAVHRYGSDPEVVRYLPWGPNTRSDTQAFLGRKLDSQRSDPRRAFDLAVTLASGGELIGAAGVRITSPQFRTAIMGYAYRRDAWGMGYATEAAGALVAFGFQKLGMHRIYAFCDTDNLASARVLEKTGLQREGRLRRHVLVRGRWRDSYLYAILEDEWRDNPVV